MRIFFLLFALLFSTSAMACPAGETCAQYGGTVPYATPNGTTTRTAAARAIDVWTNVKEFSGIDCTGATDSATGLQGAITAMPDNSILLIPGGCKLKIASTISITGRVNFQITSFQYPLNVDVGAGQNPPYITWSGAGAGPVFNLIDCTSCVINGLFIDTTTSNTLNTVINLDGDGTVGHHTPTLNQITNNSITMGNQTNSSLHVISVSATSNSNNENYNISNNDIRCSNSNATVRATDGVINNTSTTLTSATATFVSGDAGKRVRVSYATGILDTTIASFTNSTTVTLSAAATSSQTGATIHIGTSYGSGIYQSGGNSFHERYYGNRIAGCAAAYDMVNGNFDIIHYGGGPNDIGVKIGNGSGTLQQYDAELDVQGITGLGSIIVTHMRMAIGNAVASGWITSSGVGNFVFIGSNSPESTPPTNSVLFSGGGVAKATFINTNFDTNVTFAQANICSFANTAFINAGFKSVTGFQSGYCGTTGLPTSCSGLPTGSLRNNSGAMAICP